MKAKENTKKLGKASKSALLSLVAERLKGRELFPERNKEAKRYLQNAKISSPL